MFCEKLNDTFGTFALGDVGKETIAVIGRNEIVGNFGRCIDDFLVKKALRKCRIIGGMVIGEKLANSSFTGMMGMLQRREIDMYLRGEPDTLNEDWVKKTVPIQMGAILVGHVLRDENKKSYFNLLTNFNVGLVLSVVFLLAFLGTLSTSFLINKLAHRLRFGYSRSKRRPTKIFEKITWAVRSFGNVKKLSALGIFLLFVREYLWLTQLFLTNNIKTNKVVIDTSKILIRDEQDILKTKRVACMLRNEPVSNMIATSTTKNILWKIYHEGTRLKADMVKEREILDGDRCLIEGNPKVFAIFESDIYLIGERQVGNLMLSTQAVGVFKKLWMSAKPIYEYPMVVYYNGQKPRIGREAVRATEFGFINRMHECAAMVAKENCRKMKIELFETEKEYIEEYSGFSDLVLENFRAIFLYHFVICSLIFLAFCVHHLVDFAKGKRNHFNSCVSLLNELAVKAGSQ